MKKIWKFAQSVAVVVGVVRGFLEVSKTIIDFIHMFGGE